MTQESFQSAVRKEYDLKLKELSHVTRRDDVRVLLMALGGFNSRHAYVIIETMAKGGWFDYLPLFRANLAGFYTDAEIKDIWMMIYDVVRKTKEFLESDMQKQAGASPSIPPQEESELFRAYRLLKKQDAHLIVTAQQKPAGCTCAPMQLFFTGCKCGARTGASPQKQADSSTQGSLFAKGDLVECVDSGDKGSITNKWPISDGSQYIVERFFQDKLGNWMVNLEGIRFPFFARRFRLKDSDTDITFEFHNTNLWKSEESDKPEFLEQPASNSPGSRAMIFAQGDLVECVDGGNKAAISNGSQYTVERFFQYDEDNWMVKLEGLPSNYLAKRFRLVKAHCSCPSHLLLAGCQCGAFQREQNQE